MGDLQTTFLSVRCAVLSTVAVMVSLCGCAASVALPQPADFIAKRLYPSNDRNWRPEQSRLAWAEVDGDRYTIRNIRNNEYLTEDEFVPSYYDRQIRLSQIRSVDYVVVPFPKQPNLAHTMLSFEVDDGSYITVSAEVRKEMDEDYSVFKGLGREFEMMYVVGDEKDLIRLRASHRDNDVYLYPTVATPAQSQQLFANMMAKTNQLAAQPEFYNTLTNNCTTTIRRHINELQPNRVAHAWQVLLPGHSDRFAYDLGLLDQRVPFEDLKAASHVSQLANEFYNAPNFSSRIRMGRNVINRIASQQQAMQPILQGPGGQYLERLNLR
ncbi:lipoprotein N-acyltransferase Lnb domain-containing protein [Mariniblastus fucicola]|uniref:Lnb N-terminal periplasmic domain-containing protein n=1 Tax=Mariniblastus fucicola TaxID=980251 RepID=A0A5B9PGY2_9BACT|nr:DUF4105 domain-containing protein [Mariniblastus fucicola]QEG24495.1 hypothetical protein MFFC18_44150 [Mariniblastus fucicola]